MVICIISVLLINNADTTVEKLPEVQIQPKISVTSNEDKIRGIIQSLSDQDLTDAKCSKVENRLVNNLGCKIKNIGLLSLSPNILLNTFDDDELLFCNLLDEKNQFQHWMDKSQKHDYCIAGLGSALMDLDICDKSNVSAECCHAIAVTSDIVTLNECNTLNKGIGFCYMGVAARTQDTKICDFDEDDNAEFSRAYNYKNNCLNMIKNYSLLNES